MMTSQELRTSPLFENISYEDYRRMLTCFQAVQRSFLPEEMIYDFAGSRAGCYRHRGARQRVPDSNR